MPELKVTNAHLERDAYLYIRQSTPRQVLENTESTQRQYALRERAVALGWPVERVRVIDCDLGKTGSQVAGRDGFQQLVSEVALGKAGMIMGLEVSRLARNCADWHRLMELCEISGTLILDEDALYDPAIFNDKLLLGLKGELSQAELHFLKARMRGGVLNKARRGELEMRPPIGLVYLPDGSMGIDPDREIQSAIRMVFDTFERTGSALQTVRYFREEGLRFPRRIRAGERKGELLWVQAEYSRINQILHNPRYAGAFVYGRTRTRRKPDGKFTQLKVSPEEWQFLIRDVHPGYISWDRFEANQKRLAENGLAFSTTRRSGPPREGPALLQGRVLCGLCGERMGVHYWRGKESVRITYVCQAALVRRGSKVCQRVPGNIVDRAVSDLLLELVQPMTLEVALAVEQEVKARCAETDALRRQQVERARYEAELARRRYMSVDPDNRLVSSSLEAEWNEKLRAHAAAQEDYERHTEQQYRLSEEEIREKVLSLATDFPGIWNDPELEARERKRMLRLLIEDVTLIKADKITAHVRLRGGATRTLTVDRPLPITQIRKTKPEVVAEIDALLNEHCDREVAEILNQRGHRTWPNQPFTLKKIEHIRGTYHLKSRFRRLREQGLLTAKEMSKTLGVCETTVHDWARSGLLRRIDCYTRRNSLYEPLRDSTNFKGHGGRRATALKSGQGAI
ncbi:MAG TPA: recombinase family protein [Terriglobales bacterium]|nr:recombinase family protein [Terriglobales bacterium]